MSPEEHRREQLRIALAAQRKGEPLTVGTVRLEFEIFAETATDLIDGAMRAAEAVEGCGVCVGKVDHRNVTGPYRPAEFKKGV